VLRIDYVWGMSKSVLILFSFCFILSVANCQNRAGIYLANNQFDLCSNPALDSSLSNFKVFFTGEYHAVAGNSKSQIAMIKYLNKTHSLKKVIYETSFSHEDYINTYVLRGNLDSLKLFGPYLGFLNSFGKVMEFLYEYNLILPQGDKISVKCIDTESEYQYAIKVFLSEFENRPLPSEIKLKIDRLKKINTENKDSSSISHMKLMIDTIYADMKANRKSYELCLNGKYLKCERLIEGTRLGVGSTIEESFSPNTLEQHIKDSVDATARELFMFKNIVNIIKEFPNEIFFGQFGKAHCTLSPKVIDKYSKSWTSLASMLYHFDTSPVQGKVCSIDRVRKRGVRYAVINAEYSWGNEEEKLFDGQFRHTLYKLDNPNSPFLDEALRHQYILQYKKYGSTCKEYK